MGTHHRARLRRMRIWKPWHLIHPQPPEEDHDSTGNWKLKVADMADKIEPRERLRQHRDRFPPGAVKDEQALKNLSLGPGSFPAFAAADRRRTWPLNATALDKFDSSRELGLEAQASPWKTQVRALPYAIPMTFSLTPLLPNGFYGVNFDLIEFPGPLDCLIWYLPS